MVNIETHEMEWPTGFPGARSQEENTLYDAQVNSCRQICTAILGGGGLGIIRFVRLVLEDDHWRRRLDLR